MRVFVKIAIIIIRRGLDWDDEVNLGNTLMGPKPVSFLFLVRAGIRQIEPPSYIS